MACDPQTLVDNARCIECGIPAGMQMSVLIYLMCLIQAGGGTGGGGSGTQQVFQDNGAPVNPPTDPTKPAIYTDLTSGIISSWNVGTQTWV